MRSEKEKLATEVVCHYFFIFRCLEIDFDKYNLKCLTIVNNKQGCLQEHKSTPGHNITVISTLKKFHLDHY